MQRRNQIEPKFLRFKLFVRDPIGLIVALSLFGFYLREFLAVADLRTGFSLMLIAALTVWFSLNWKTRFLAFLSTVRSKNIEQK
jgi:hypothetical protein